MDGRTVVWIYIGILCAVFDYERNVKNFFKNASSLLKTQLFFWNYCNWLIPIIISLRQIVFKIVLCNLILCTWVFFIIKLIFHKISYPLCSDAQVANMWHSWKRLAYLYISNGHISSIKASFPNIMSFGILYEMSNPELFIKWLLANIQKPDI